MPASVNPDNPPDPVGTAVRRLQARAPHCAGAAILLGLVGAGLLACGPRRAAELPAFTFQAEPLLPWLAAPTAVTAGALLFCWPDPRSFPPSRVPISTGSSISPSR